MRITPSRWHTETWVCSLRGHCTPAETVAHLRDEDRRLGIEIDPGHRLVRCLRCDSWIEVTPPSADEQTAEYLAPLGELPHPRRGKALQDAVFVRLIALERSLHSLAFTLLTVALVVLDSRLPLVKSTARDLRNRLTPSLSNSGQQATRNWLTHRLTSVLNISGHTLAILAITSAVYAVVEGVEAVGLWHERRWAEYLTALATAGFMPFEIRELWEKATVVRVGALVVNLAILLWLVWNKHLFKLRGGSQTLHQDSSDWDAIVASSAPAPRRAS